MTTFTDFCTSSFIKPNLAEQIACVEREIWTREVVYVHRRQAAKMSARKAETELQAMRAVLEMLRGIKG